MGLGDERYVGDTHLLMVDDGERQLLREVVRSRSDLRGVGRWSTKTRDVLVALAAILVAGSAIASLIIQIARG